MRIEYDRHGLRVAGRRKLVRSVSFDYFRLPSASAWRDRIQKIAQAGFNCVALSYPWSYHADAQGVYDFSGTRDVDLLHDMIQEAGLYLIARPGPYIGADLDAGGLPAWLFRDESIDLRCRAWGELNHSLEFMQQVEEWLDQIVPRFAERPNLLLVEVEHQYSIPTPLPWLRSDTGSILRRLIGTKRVLALSERWLGEPFIVPTDRDTSNNGQRNSYMRALNELVRDRGVVVPTVHADLSREVRQLDVELPALERRRIRSARDASALEAELRAFRGDGEANPPEVPLIYLGLDAGATDRWGGPGYDRLREQASTCPIEALVLGAIAEGASVINVRRFCGGASWGYMGCSGMYTSYDCAAPISESGRTSPAYDAVCNLNRWLVEFEEELLESRLLEHRSEDRVLQTQRRSQTRSFRFIQSTSPSEVNLAYPDEPRAKLTPFETQIRVYESNGRIESVSDRFRTTGGSLAPSKILPALPKLSRWTFSGVSSQLDASFDDASWTEISEKAVERGSIDMDALGAHHGFIWYRGVFSGVLDRLVLTARHSWAAWLNRELIGHGDPTRRPESFGFEPPSRKSLRIPRAHCNDGRNTLVVLVESLGHPEGILDDMRERCGLLYLDTGVTRIQWRCRGGLVRGERGLAPIVAFEAVERTTPVEVSLPHGWRTEPAGIGLYETSFRLDGVDPSSCQFALRLDPGRGKANVYVNGALMGRYWPERGPQNEFPVPWGILEPDHDNHIAIAVWKRAERAALGAVQLVLA